MDDQDKSLGSQNRVIQRMLYFLIMRYLLTFWLKGNSKFIFILKISRYIAFQGR